MTSAAPWYIYADQLFPLQYGHPLWLPDSYGREVNVGDVGWLVNGGFRSLLNAIQGPDDPTYTSSPPSFQRLDPQKVPEVNWPAITQPFICSRSIRRLEAGGEGHISSDV